MSIPDALGVARILMTPVVMVLVLAGTPASLTAAAVVFVAAAFTDFLDGYLARRWKIGTILGAFIDSTADKLLVIGALLALLVIDRASVWAVLIIVAREIVVMTLRGIVAIEGATVRPSKLGKLKANSQYVAIVLAMFRWGSPFGGLYLDEWVLWLAAILTVASGWGYAQAFWSVVRRVDR